MKKLLFILFLCIANTASAKFEIDTVRVTHFERVNESALYKHIKPFIDTVSIFFIPINTLQFELLTYSPKDIDFSRIIPHEENRIAIIGDKYSVVVNIKCPESCLVTASEIQKILKDFADDRELGEVIIGLPLKSYRPHGVPPLEERMAYTLPQFWKAPPPSPETKNGVVIDADGKTVTIRCTCIEKDLIRDDKMSVLGTGSSLVQAKADALFKCQTLLGRNDVFGPTVDETSLQCN